ncbi:UNVERIFIED_ORG: hypothetical protein [Escherichia phage CMSTMSU]
MENLSSILVQDDFGNHGSAIIVRGNKATFVIAGGPVQRSIKTMPLLLIMYAIA